MLGLNDPEVIERAKAGELGPAMRILLSDEDNSEWLVNENAFYLCTNCGSVIKGNSVRINDGSGNRLVFYYKPPTCASCGEELFYEEDKVPMSKKELSDRCVEYKEIGCPNCGKNAIKLDFSCWD